MSISQSSRASALAISASYKDLRSGTARYLPQRIALFAQGASATTYSVEKWASTSAAAAGARYGYGSPIHLALRALQPANGDGVGTIPIDVFPLEDGYEAVAATGTITPSGTQTSDATYRVRVSGILSAPFVVKTTDTVADICDKIVAAINAILEMPVIATDGTTDVALAAKWAGPSGNDIYVEIVGDSLGVTYAIVQPTGGLVYPTVDDALLLVGEVWETMALNCSTLADTDALDAFKTFGEGRWDDLVRKPWVVFVGSAEATYATAVAVSDSRKDDRVNAQLVAPGSVNLPFVVAARQLARIAAVANDNPPTGYRAQRATGLLPGDDGDQWDYATRDLAVKAGSSTVEVKDGVVNIGDVVTFYHPTGEDPPAYRYVVNIVKLQNCLYNFDAEFSKPEWAAAPLISDDDATVNPNAKQPKMAKGKANQILQALGDAAILANVKAAKEKTTAAINSDNPDRLDLGVEFALSGNTNIISIPMVFGFNFGGSA